MEIPPRVRDLIEQGRLAHLVTIEPDGRPQVAVVWVGIDGDEIVSGHLSASQRKLVNMQRDPRVAVSIEAEPDPATAMTPYVVLHGRARVTAGGGADLLRRLTEVYLGPGVAFIPPDAPDGYVARITVERIGGMGDWTN